MPLKQPSPSIDANQRVGIKNMARRMDFSAFLGLAASRCLWNKRLITRQPRLKPFSYIESSRVITRHHMQNESATTFPARNQDELTKHHG